MRRLVAVAAVAALAAVLPSSIRAEEPRRAGTITGGVYTHFAMFNGEAIDCQGTGWTWGPNPECRVWLASGCDARLAGRDPAVTASIEDISALADGTTTRTFKWRGGAPATVGWGGVVVQLWTGDCKEIRDAKWHSREGRRCCRDNAKETTFAIPRQARWMTVTTNDNLKVEWTLR